MISFITNVKDTLVPRQPGNTGRAGGGGASGATGRYTEGEDRMGGLRLPDRPGRTRRTLGGGPKTRADRTARLRDAIAQ